MTNPRACLANFLERKIQMLDFAIFQHSHPLRIVNSIGNTPLVKSNIFQVYSYLNPSLQSLRHAEVGYVNNCNNLCCRIWNNKLEDVYEFELQVIIIH